MTTNSTLRALVDLRDRQIQKARIQFGNRVEAITRGDDDANNQQFQIAKKWHGRFSELESELDKDIKVAVKDEIIYKPLTSVKGVGPMMAAKLIAMIDIERCNTISALWRFAGYAVIDGERERPVKGEQLHYNIRLKTTVYLVATSFLRTNSPYRKFYDNAKEYYANSRDWTKLHVHNAAMRKMSKMFLSHLWLVWRQLEGLPVREPYVKEKLGHENIVTPQECGWDI